MLRGARSSHSIIINKSRSSAILQMSRLADVNDIGGETKRARRDALTRNAKRFTIHIGIHDRCSSCWFYLCRPGLLSSSCKIDQMCCVVIPRAQTTPNETNWSAIHDICGQRPPSTISHSRLHHHLFRFGSAASASAYSVINLSTVLFKVESESISHGSCNDFSITND